MPIMEHTRGSFLKCSLCKLTFNLKNREPINLICCGETGCRECVETLMIKTQSKQLVIKGQFDCSYCHSNHCQQEGFDKPVELSINKHIKKLIEESLPLPQVYCDSHPHKVASKFCRKHLSLICKDCLIENHLDHSQDCKSVVNENIAEFFKNHQSILMSLNARIIELSDEITSFVDHLK